MKWFRRWRYRHAPGLHFAEVPHRATKAAKAALADYEGPDRTEVYNRAHRAATLAILDWLKADRDARQRFVDTGDWYAR